MASNSNKQLFQAEPVLLANSVTVLKKRYLRKKESGQVETPKDLFIRVAKNIAEAELKFDSNADVDSVADIFYTQMASLKFLPNSPTLMNAGNALQQLSACFVLPVEDSLEGIFEAVKYTALIHKSGGGTGFSFSRLRPKDDSVKTTKGVSSGPVSFMSVFDAATETIKQGGMRRGANMGILRVDHPDIMEFIYAKQDKTKLTNFNLSVGITEEFMKSVKKGTDYDLLTPRDRKKVGSKNAKEVFNEIRVYPFTILKQIIIPIIAYPVLSFFIQDPLILGVSLIMIAMPVGNIAVLFATEYQKDVALAAKTVFMTTLLSIITIPVIVALFLI